MKNFGFKTKCRAIFINSICLYYDYENEIDENLFNSIHNFAKELLTINPSKYLEYLDLILYFKLENHEFKPIETEETVASLFNILDTIHSFNDMVKLFDDVGQKNVDKITELANLYLSYSTYLESIPIIPIKQ